MDPPTDTGAAPTPSPLYAVTIRCGPHVEELLGGVVSDWRGAVARRPAVISDIPAAPKVADSGRQESFRPAQNETVRLEDIVSTEKGA